ncbi:glutathione S-transferase family protein [Variovorax sp. PCZ-1]|uniref:glutathione S-transferase family protein n=1 Tax=Variovorax sp. PCZ-1 TaxID=2835533 RepID=UPI001BD170AD|nr:glutathione S-transferase family protein [Variovorax sp. PCZ-1]MBS7806632.1 glutathione S-transferase family protein [Variovorax sp. PCZ-1]
MKLYIGNKNYSSWSMRPWVMLKNAGIAFEEIKLRFDSMDAGSEFKNAIEKISPVGKVPVLVDGSLTVWDTLAIAEYAAETFPEKQLWPADKAQRARARSICAEMHSGFTNLRGACMMNIEASLHEVGALVLRDKPAVAADVKRIETIWSELLSVHGGPYLFGSRFTIADAYFAPVCMRFKTYELSAKPQIKAYIETIRNAPGVKDWIADALVEDDFREFEEPYRLKR